MPHCRLSVAAFAFASLAASPLSAQQLTRADSNLVHAILTAEDRRDSLAPALAEGMRHADPRIRQLAERARERMADSTFAARSALPAPLPRATWPLPPWRARLDSVRLQRADCHALERGMLDPIAHVRHRAMDLVTVACLNDDEVVGNLRNALRQTLDGQTVWQDGAHAVVAMARLSPTLFGPYRTAFARSTTWQLRMYAARGARVAQDTSLLRALTRDRDGNVVEAAVEGLAAVAGHAEDSTYLRALGDRHPQAARAAAIALKGSTHPLVRPRAERALSYWNGRRHDSERDVRFALLDLLGRSPADDIPWNPPPALPREVVPLALGRMDTLQVTLGSGRSFLVRLRGDIAPITAARVLALVDRGTYRNTSWHRVIPDFVIQGGLPGANEYVGGSDFFRDELGNVSHLRGGVGISTRGHDTGDGQWFIDLSDLPRLDRDYTLFGEVVAGMEVVDEVLEGEVIRSISRLRPTR